MSGAAARKLLYPTYPAYPAYLGYLTYLFLIVAAACGGPPQPAEPVTVFAAASLKTALDALLTPCSAAGAPFRASYAASSTLARQIEEGAEADIFISADLEWMDYVAARNLIQAATRVNLLGNRLILVAPQSQPVTLAIEPGFALAKALGDDGRLAVADPVAVPAGKYAKAALTSLGVWDSVANRLAPADNVRAALLLVSRAEAPLGIVYRSDAVADQSVVTVAAFSDTTHPPIVYPAALTTRASAAAGNVLGCLRGDAARAEFKRQGFDVIDQPAGR